MIVAGTLFLLCGLNYERIADYLQRRHGQSDKMRAVGIAVMRPLIFMVAAMAFIFAYMFFSGRA